jgi:hypothetical protein
MMTKEQQRAYDNEEEEHKQAPLGMNGATIDDRRCPLCEVVHSTVDVLAEEGDAERLNRLKGACSPKVTAAALYTLYNLADKVLTSDTACMRAAEHAARFMLTQGAQWILPEVNLRARRNVASSAEESASSSAPKPSASTSAVQHRPLTEMPATTVQTIRETPAESLTKEPLVQAFSCHLNDHLHNEFAALNALGCISSANLEKLRKEAAEKLPYSDDLLQCLKRFPLSLTHYAEFSRVHEQPKGKQTKKTAQGPQTHTLSLYSRTFLDQFSDELGIKDYPKGNTPSMAFKNIGHTDYVFLAIEPRENDAVTRPKKVGSRFGNVCHLVDFAQLPFASILTLGDLDTCNAKIGSNRLTLGSDPMTAAGLGFGAIPVKSLVAHCETKTVAGGSTIQVRKFDTRSEQMFLRDDIKEALALRVLIDCATYGFLNYGHPDTPLTAADYNCLINGLYVPQIMVPRAFCTEKAYIFE